MSLYHTTCAKSHMSNAACTARTAAHKGHRPSQTSTPHCALLAPATCLQWRHQACGTVWLLTLLVVHYHWWLERNNVAFPASLHGSPEGEFGHIPSYHGHRIECHCSCAHFLL